MASIMTKNPLTDVTFDSFDLHPDILSGVATTGFTHCTPIQAQTLPVALAGRDVAGQAQTGTGKTAAFLLVIFQRLLSTGSTGKSLRSLVLAPTRELALQIHKDAEDLGKNTGLKFGLAYGGVDYEKQRTTLAGGVDVLIGTPGRIIDYYKQNVFTLRNVDVVVLDEADRMFDLGFIKDIRFLLRGLPEPEKRQGLMFSATLGHRVTELAYEHMNDPELIKIESESVTVENVAQSVYYPANHEKLPLLVRLLRGMEDGKVMIFSNTRNGADLIYRTLSTNGFEAGVLSGRVHQRKRQSLLRQFFEGELNIIAATDVAARGLHIPDVTHVINFDIPQDAEDYVHRVGRTARLGARGDAISFACEDYAFHLPEVEDYIGYQIPVEALDEESLPSLKSPLPRKKEEGGRHHGRGKPRHSGQGNRGRGRPGGRR